MIESFKHKGLKLFWETGNSKALPSVQVKKIRRVLDIIDNLKDVPQDLLPFRGMRPQQLKGDLQGYWSMDITGNYRILFRFEDGKAYDLTYIDTH
ncbi:type II toxin-antitoxin system RelE/ParE family toxin [Pleomorphovibrio marinus]|uniref:type II toxin-antitoxin system RelE/ParE family toxin n=1 Tax=Pleomorphovibrio marinus TaxID=2164132 RepID=UPI000E0C67F8|nr:type II toxin-antitoxin system RelE/ParE family toxin [Pleomorphovibrio marinus]